MHAPRTLGNFKKIFLARPIWLTLALFLIFPPVAPAQKTSARRVETRADVVAAATGVQTFELGSRLTARPMPYRVAFPAGYFAARNAKTRYPVVYLLHGLSGHFDNWTDKTRLADYARAFNLLIVTPEGGDGWFTDSASAPRDRFESYIVEELIAEIDAKFRTVADKKYRFVAGLSMGGYGAIKFGLKYPRQFALVGSFSGALDAPLRGQNHPFLRPSIVSVFGAENSRTRIENDIFRLAREMPVEKIKDLPFIYLDCGTEDLFLETNREFAALLLERKIPHEFRQLPGRHDWKFWEAQAREFLRLSRRFVDQSKAKAH